MKCLVIFTIFIVFTLYICGTNSSDYNDFETRAVSGSPEGPHLPNLPIRIPNMDFLSARLNIRKFHGEFCNKIIQCDTRAWLNCIDGKCGCMQPDEMVYLPKTRKCVSKAGAKCKFPLNDHGQDDENTLGPFKNAECVENAICDSSSGNCTCGNLFYENSNGTCTPKGGHKKLCRPANAECRDDKHLSCIGGVCACDSNHVYDDIEDKSQFMCVGKAGKVTENGEHCVPGAQVNNAGICTCLPESTTYAGFDGFCHKRKTNNQVCTEDLECQFENTYLKCIEGICSCERNISLYREFVGPVLVEKERQVYNPRYEYDYDEPNYIMEKYNDFVNRTLRQCVGLPGKECNTDGHCVENAVCEKSGNTSVCTYVKEKGFSEIPKGNFAKHGQICSALLDCSDAFMCTNGKCNCPQPNHQTFNNLTETCESIIHGACSTDSDCIKNAGCAVNINTNLPECQCREGFVENLIGNCELAYGSPCNYTDESIPCDKLAGLECRNQACACPDSFTYFDTDLRECLGLVGSRCNAPANVNGTKVCVNNAKCISGHSKLPGICQCDVNYVTTEGKLCQINFSTGSNSQKF